MGALANATQQPTQQTMPETIDALLEAARYDDIEDLLNIATTGVSLESKDSQGRTALHMAAANGHMTIVDYLIQHGADVDVSDAAKNTPLHWACLNARIEVVKRLVIAGVNLSALNSHEGTPVNEALHERKLDIVDAINEATAQVELTGASIS